MTHLKEARKLAKFRKIGTKNDTLVNNKSFLFKDESIKDLCRSENNTSYCKDFDGEEDDIEMTDNDEDILDIDTFIKLLRAGQDSTNFKYYRILYLCNPHLSK